MKVFYTESGQKEIDEFKARQAKLIEELVTQRKFVFGDDLVEITGSDIRDAASRIITIPTAYSKGTIISDLLPKLYMAGGLMVSAGALLWPYIKDLQNEPQFAMTIGGIVMTLLGYFMQILFRKRNRRYLEIQMMRDSEMVYMKRLNNEVSDSGKATYEREQRIASERKK